MIVVGGIAGLAPDSDIPLSWAISWITGTDVSYHGLYTHTLFFVALFLIIGLVRQYQKDSAGAMLWYVIAFGWFVHLPLDWVYGWCKNFFWPIASTFPYCPRWVFSDSLGASIDAILLTLWLVHEEVHKKVKDYF